MLGEEQKTRWRSPLFLWPNAHMQILKSARWMSVARMSFQAISPATFEISLFLKTQQRKAAEQATHTKSKKELGSRTTLAVQNQQQMPSQKKQTNPTLQILRNLRTSPPNLSFIACKHQTEPCQCVKSSPLFTGSGRPGLLRLDFEERQSQTHKGSSLCRAQFPTAPFLARRLSKRQMPQALSSQRSPLSPLS